MSIKHHLKCVHCTYSNRITLLEGALHFLVKIVIHCLVICTNCVFADLKFLVIDNSIGVGYPFYIFVIPMEALLYIFLHP